ncbi:MAG: FAD-binding oxidoreductase [Asticcacaulis sp.]
MRNTGHPPESYYAATADIPAFPAFAGDAETDVAIIGGGFTGLGAALELAQKGINVTLLESAAIGSGASGRNGGQIHIGQRIDPHTLESKLGFDAAHQLWDMAIDARLHLQSLLDDGIDADYRAGIIHSWHKPQFAADDRAYIDYVSRHYGYDQLSLLSKPEVARELGTDVYHGGLYDGGGGHLHPLKLAIGMAHKAESAGAKLYEHSPVHSFQRTAKGITLITTKGRLTAKKLLICGNGYMQGLDQRIDRHVLPINNFILVTAPLTDPAILPNNYAAADSRFVVHYWRKTADNRLLFGGGENYSPRFPRDIKAFVRKHMLNIYPQLETTPIDYGWGGTLAITLSRAPFVRELEKDVFISAGYSGQGVVLATYFGKLLARAVTGNRHDIDLLSQLPVPAFVGGKLLRWPIQVAGLSYYALRDRF